METKKIAKLGMLLSISLVLSYLENLLPVMIAVPGVKLGLANIITMLLLYHADVPQTFFFMSIRVVLSGLLFSGLSGILYSFAGGVFCIFIMSIMKRFSIFSMMGVSMMGAIFHNAGQILVAACMMENANIIYYLPVLCISGTISGLLIGYLTCLIINQYNKMITKD